MSEIVNRVAKSSLITLDVDALLPKIEVAELDIAPQLWQGLALKEKDFRAWVKEHEWESYTDKHTGIYCSADAIIPLWAYMLIASALQPYATSISEGTKNEIEQLQFEQFFNAWEVSDYAEKRIVIKGCADRIIAPRVYMALVNRLQPVAKSLMFGEACSTVPVWKKPK